MVAIIKAGRTAASESGGQKRNKTSEISGQLPLLRSNKTLREQNWSNLFVNQMDMY